MRSCWRLFSPKAARLETHTSASGVRLIGILVLLLNVCGLSAAQGVTITEYPVASTSVLWGIAPGPDGALWFTDEANSFVERITTAGVISLYPTPTPGASPVGIAAGPDGALWFTEVDANQIGRITTAGGWRTEATTDY